MSCLTFINIENRLLFRFFINVVIFLIKLSIPVMLGLLMFRASMIDGGTPLLCNAYDYTSLPKLKGPTFGEIFSETICIKEILLWTNAVKCRHSATLTSHTIFSTLIFHRCRTSQVSWEKSGSLVP
jgi:hypothetical protein